MSESSLYLMCSLILSQCRDLRMGVIREDLGALTTVRASSESVGCDVHETTVTVVKFRVDTGQ